MLSRGKGFGRTGVPRPGPLSSAPFIGEVEGRVVDLVLFPEDLGPFLQQLGDGEMLRAESFAMVAFQALAGRSAGQGHAGIIHLWGSEGEVEQQKARIFFHRRFTIVMHGETAVLNKAF